MAMTTEHKEKIRRNYVQLMQDMNVIDVVDWLYSDGVLTTTMKEKITVQQTQQDKSMTLLDMLPMRSDVAYDKLLYALRQSHNQDLAQLLEDN